MNEDETKTRKSNKRQKAKISCMPVIATADDGESALETRRISKQRGLSAAKKCLKLDNDIPEEKIARV